MELTRVTIGHALMVLGAVIFLADSSKFCISVSGFPRFSKRRPQIVEVRSAPEVASGHAFGSRTFRSARWRPVRKRLIVRAGSSFAAHQECAAAQPAVE